MEDQTKQSPASEADTDERSPTPPADDTGRDLLAENAALREQIRLSEARERMTAELAAAGARSPGLLFDSAKTRLQFADDGRIGQLAAPDRHHRLAHLARRRGGHAGQRAGQFGVSEVRLPP